MDTAKMAACPNCFGDLSATPCPHCGWQPGSDNPPPALALGTLLDGRYRIGRVLGHGGFGITYLARDENLQLRLAIKEYLPRDCATRAPDGVSLAIYSGQAGEQFAYGLDRFLDEARALARFDQHPGVVTVKSFFRAHGTGYCVMDYVEGLTLKQYLERQPGGRIPVEQAWRLLQPVMDALRAVHKEGLLHRDLAPDNIYITRDGRVKLLDFGAARFAAGEHSRSLSIILKPGYAPEEQYRSRGKQGPWTDVYGLAATLYRAITGTAPPEALDRLDEDDLVAPSRVGIAITAGQEAVLLKALAVKADARYPSMQGLLEGGRALQSEQAKPAAGAPHPPKDPIGSQASDTPAPDSAMSLPENPSRRGIGWLLAIVVIGVMAFAGLSAFFEADDSTLLEPPPTQDVVPTTPSTPSPILSSRYRPLGADGSIIEDQTTGLQWMRCSQGQHWNGVTCDGNAAELTWEEAMQQPRGFSFAGHTDWRVPTKDELLTLVYCSSGRPKTWNDTGDRCEGDYERPTIDRLAFPGPGTPNSWFWSSSPYAGYSDNAWLVNFSNGYVDYSVKRYMLYVRLVRGGPPIRDATPTPQPVPPPQVMSDRYRPLGVDGSIIEDRTTGLQWMRCSHGQHWNGVTCGGSASKLTWEDAMQQPRGFSFAEYTDWRVPTKDELRTLIYCSSGQPETWNDTDDSCEGDYERPTIDKVAFPLTEVAWFWSSSSDPYGSSDAWSYSFYSGSVYGNGKDGERYVRLVRGGPPIRDATPTPQPAPPPLVMSDRYRPLGTDGSIIEDRTTGLQWMRCSQGQHWNGVTCDGSASKLTWEEVMRQPRGFSFGGYTDWRVPTKDELLTLVYCSSSQPKVWNDTGASCKGDFESPTIDQVAFPWIRVGLRLFWSSSLGAYARDYVLGVHFGYGDVLENHKGNQRHVRLVRGGAPIRDATSTPQSPPPRDISEGDRTPQPEAELINANNLASRSTEAKGKIAIYYAADTPPESNIPPEAPLCYRFKVSGLEEQLSKLRAKYQDLYDDEIVADDYGGKTLIAKRKDASGREIKYFYSTTPKACSDYQSHNSKTQMMHSPMGEIRVTINEHGAILEYDADRLYMGKDCDAYSARHGKGTWGWANGGFVIEFQDERYGFPKMGSPLDQPNCRL